MSVSAQHRQVAASMVEEVLCHLQSESNHLEEMVITCRELQRRLRQRPKDSADQLPRVFDSIERRQSDINHDREAILVKLSGIPGRPANLSAFMGLLEPAQQERIRRLRSEIFDKLETVRSITLGSQMVLYYSLDFYQRMMRGLSGNDQSSSGYTPSGRCDSLETGQVITRNC